MENGHIRTSSSERIADGLWGVNISYDNNIVILNMS